MKESRFMFIAIALTSACSIIRPTPTQPIVPTVAVQQVALNPPSSTSTEVLTSTPAPTNTSTDTPTGIPPYALTSSLPDTLGIHVVRSGEWLYCIGRAYRVLPSAIATVNGLRSPNVIFPGQRLTIPNVLWTNIPAGPVCKAQFTVSASSPTPTYTSAPSTAALTQFTASPTNTPTITPTPTTATLVVVDELIPVTPVPSDTPPPPGTPGTINAGCSLCVDPAKMVISDTTPDCSKLSDPTGPNPPWRSSDNIYMLWVEYGNASGQELSIEIDQNDKPLLTMNHVPAKGNWTCRHAKIPFTAPGSYKAILTWSVYRVTLSWSIKK